MVILQHRLPCGPHTSSVGVRQRLGIEALILILVNVPNCRYDLITGPILLPGQVFFSCWGTENSQMVPNQENMEGDQPVQATATAVATTELCASVFEAVLKCIYTLQKRERNTTLIDYINLVMGLYSSC